jgi:ketosteroid isomerase-like protein
MSEENVGLVRQRIALTPHTHRRVEQRLVLRFPRLFMWGVRRIWRLSPRSRLRQAVVRRAFQMGVEAINRKDFKAAFALYHPQVEVIPDSRLVQLGFEHIYRGPDGRVRFQQRWLAEWGEVHFAPEELIDFGHRLFVHGRLVGSGRSSGAAFENYMGTLFTFDAGQVIREQFFFDRAHALEAAGLSE